LLQLEESAVCPLHTGIQIFKFIGKRMIQDTIMLGFINNALKKISHEHKKKRREGVSLCDTSLAVKWFPKDSI